MQSHSDLARFGRAKQYPPAFVNALILTLLAISLVLLFIPGTWYGRRIARSLKLDESRPTPAREKNDGKDFVPSKPYVLFAHHFAAIAGAGPIVGPTLAMAYGWMPALVWIILGSIFLGGVHDMCVLFVSLREGARSIAEVAKQCLGQFGYTAFVAFLVLALFMITATFLNLSVTALTSFYPAAKVGLSVPDQATLATAYQTGSELYHHPGNGPMPTSVQKTDSGDYVLTAKIGGIASTSVLFITLLSPLLGWLIYRKGTPGWFNYPLAAFLCGLSVWLGLHYPVVVTPNTWRMMMTVYVVLASAVPVWLLLMPRDFINVQILYAGLAAIVGGLIVGALFGQPDAFPSQPADVSEAIPVWSPVSGMEFVGPLWPMLLITISCGAISGFHCLVSSGTTARQISSERGVLGIGFNAMLLEALLAVAVILTLLLGLDWAAYKDITYGAKNPILAISLATGNVCYQAFGIPVWAGTVLGILLLEGFVVTTLDVAVRLNRYLMEEIWATIFRHPPALLRSIWFNTALCAGVMFFLSLWNTLPILWRVFGSANQMMAAMALLVVAVWLKQHGRRTVFVLIPAVIMFATTLASTATALWQNFASSNWPLVAMCLLLLGLGLIMAWLGGRKYLSLSPSDARALTP